MKDKGMFLNLYEGGGGVEYKSGNLDEITRIFMKRRFDKTEKGDKSYYDKWKNRIKGAVHYNDFSDNMDNESIRVLKEVIEEVKDKYYDGGMPERGRETITRPAPTTTPTETPSKPDKDNPYLPKVKPKPKASKLILLNK